MPGSTGLLTELLFALQCLSYSPTIKESCHLQRLYKAGTLQSESLMMDFCMLWIWSW